MRINAFHNDYTAVLEPAEDGGFVAHCAEVAASSQGQTETEALDNLVDAIKLVLQTHRDERFAAMSEQARCYKVSVHEEVEAAPLSAGQRLRPAS